MIKGTTPTFRLTINDDSVDLTAASSVYATFKQQNGISLSKSGSDVTVAEKQVEVTLSQEETLRFARGPLAIQLNWVYSDGTRACSKITVIQVEENLIESVLE